jgi:hemerythrin-like metal-binding protein
LGAVLDKLIVYTKTHFATEETLFRTHGYPQAARTEGTRGTDREGAGAAGRLKAGKSVISAPVLDFLRDWLTNHILKQDMAYKLFFAAKGVK